MADVCVFYAQDDLSDARALARSLETAGFSVAVDHAIAPGRPLDEAIAETIDAARLAIVIWSQRAMAAGEVQEAAQIALADQKYLPVALDDVVPPLAFRRAKAVNLAGWNGDASATAFQDLVRALRLKIPAPIAQVQLPPPPPVYQAVRQEAPATRTVIAPSATERSWITPVLFAIGALALLCIAVLIWRENVDGAGRRIEADRAAWAAIDTTDPYAVDAFHDHAQSRQYRDLAADRLEHLRASGASSAPPAPPAETVNAPPAADPLAGNWNFSSALFQCGDGDCQLEGVMTITQQGGAYACSFSVVQTSAEAGRTTAEEACTLNVGADGSIQIASRVVRSDSGAWTADNFTLTQNSPAELSGITHDGRQTTRGVPVTFTR